MNEQPAEHKLTKKEKKAKAFRASKGKGKKDDPAQADVPDAEDLDDDGAAGEDEEGGEKKTKKRKRAAEGETDAAEASADAVVEGDGERKKKRQRGKKKSLQGQGPREDGKPRLLLFTGNLPYKVTVEAIQAHFASCGETPTVRLLTPKPSPLSTVSKSKGCAFLEFQSPLPFQAALRLHESELAGRKINVELTAGGGGNSEARKGKIEEARKRLLAEREKTVANRKKRDGETEEKDKSARWGKKAAPAADATATAAATTEGAAESAPPATPAVPTDAKVAPKTQVKVVNGKKVRDRRIPKTDTDGVEKERARKSAARAAAASSGANSVQLVPNQKLLVCGKCRIDITRYCSRECQVKDWPLHKSACKQVCATMQRLELSSMTSNGRHDISLREGFAAFRKLPWVQEAITEALAVAYQIGTEHPLHTTHVVRLHYAFNFNKKHLADQFTLVSGTLLPHAHMSEILTNFSNLVQPLSPSLYSQECLNERGGPAMAAQPALLLRLPLVSTASFSDEVMHITKKRSGTRHSHTILREDPQTHQHLKDSFPTGIMQPVVVPPPSWDWVGAMRKRLEKKGAPVEVGLKGGMAAWRDRQCWLGEGVPEKCVDQFSRFITNLRKTYGWEGP